MPTCTECKMDLEGNHEPSCPLQKTPGWNPYYAPLGWVCLCGKRNPPDRVICQCSEVE